MLRVATVIPMTHAVLHVRALLQRKAVPTAVSCVRAAMSDGPCRRVLMGHRHADGPCHLGCTSTAVERAVPTAVSCARAAMTDGPCRRAHGSPSCRRRKLCAMLCAQAPLRSGLCVLPSRLRDRRCPTAHAVLCSLPSCRRRKLCAVSYAQAPLRRGLCQSPSRTCERRRPTAHAVVCSRSLSCQGGSSRAAVCGDTPADPQKRPVPGFRWG